jgi:basic membrane protein A
VNKVSRKAVAGIAMAAASLLVLSGCASSTTEDTSAPKAGAGYKECAVSDEGSWADKSFNESVMDGLLMAQAEFGVELQSAESASSEDFTPNLDAMVAAECDVIFAVGFNLVAQVNAAAKANPDIKFVTIDGWSEGNSNLKPVGYNMAESTYLAGYAAAAYSTTKTVGVYGGMQIDAVTAFMDGFYYGAKAWGVDNSTEVNVLGWDPAAKQGDFIGSFAANDPAGKVIAAGQIAAGADVLMPVGGDQFGALSEAITESGESAKMIGVDKNIAVTSPEYKDLILTSAEKRMTQAVYDIVNAGVSFRTVEKAVGAGSAATVDLLRSGYFAEYYTGTLANGGTDISESQFITGELKTKLAELKAGIIDGSINPLN